MSSGRQPLRCLAAAAPHDPAEVDIIKRGQTLGIVALGLMLAAIVALAAIDQAWVAGTVTTTGLAVVVAIFVTGRYQPGRTGLAQPSSADSSPAGCQDQ